MEFADLNQNEIDELLTGNELAGEMEARRAASSLQREVLGEDDEAGASSKSPSIGPARFEELSQELPVEAPVAGMKVLMDVPLSVSVELGKARCYVKDLLSLTAGSVVELDRAAGDPVDILINGKPFAFGEVVVIDENFGVRIREIIHKH